MPAKLMVQQGIERAQQDSKNCERSCCARNHRRNIRLFSHRPIAHLCSSILCFHFSLMLHATRRSHRSEGPPSLLRIYVRIRQWLSRLTTGYCQPRFRLCTRCIKRAEGSALQPHDFAASVQEVRCLYQARRLRVRCDTIKSANVHRQVRLPHMRIHLSS